MGKRGHHKKNLKKEKTKVKFKVGRTLPKGQNITDTSFKVKKIVIKEQLKTGGLETVTKRNLNLKETLSRLQHHNTNVKLDNLEGLKEILSKNKEMLSNNLLKIIENLSELITYRESSVRKEAISQLAFVIGEVPASKMSPFVCLLCSYLGAALSHINKDVQEDALLLLDGILSTPNFSSLILSTSPASPTSSHPFDLILQGLLNQISEQKGNYNVEKPSGWERKLNVDPGAKLADSQRRIKVLKQLHSLLKSALKMRKNSQCHENQSGFPKTVYWKDVVESGGYIYINEPSYSVPYGLPLSRRGLSSYNEFTQFSSSEPLAHCDQLKAMVTALVPILFESWKEVGPSRDGYSSNDLTLEAVELLKIILDLLDILLDALKLCRNESKDIPDLVQWFRTSYSKLLFDLFMPAFPFSSSGLHRKKNQKRKTSQKGMSWVVESLEPKETNRNLESAEVIKKGNLECFDLNLLMVQLFCILELSVPGKKKDKRSLLTQQYSDRILTFITSSFDAADVCHRHEKRMSVIIWSLVTCGRIPGEYSGKWRLSIEKIKVLIHALVTSSLQGCSSNKTMASCHFFKLLCDVLKERHLSELHSLQCFEIWVKALPDTLCFPNTEAVEVFTQIARKCNLAVFHKVLKDNLHKIFFSLKVNPYFAQPSQKDRLECMLALLHWVSYWDAEELNNLGDVIQKYPKEALSLVELFRARKEYLGQESEFSRLLESTSWWHNMNV